MMRTVDKAGTDIAQNVTKKRSQLSSIWFRFKKNKLAMLGLALLVIIVFFAVVAGVFADYEEDCVFQNMSERLLFYSKGHPLGTDQYGRDLFARIIFGARISVAMSVSTVLISMILGSILGAVAA